MRRARAAPLRAANAGTGAVLTRQLALFSLTWGIGVAIGPLVGAAAYGALGFGALGGIYVALSAGTLVAGWLAPKVALERPADAGATPSLVAGARLIAGQPVARIGLLLSIIGVAMLAIRLVLPSLLARCAAGTVLVAGMWVEVAAMSATPFLGGFWPLALAAVAFGAAHGLNPPITVELMAAHTQRAERGLAMGVRVTANRLAQVVQPAVFGALAAVLGIAAAFPASGAALAGVVLYAGRRLRAARP